MQVTNVAKPPERREGAGFIIRDIFHALPYEGPHGTDPFLMWHHLPRAHYNPGEMPGAPLHPHRGFYECPYAKTMISDKGAPEAKMLTRVVAGGVERRGEVRGSPGLADLSTYAFHLFVCVVDAPGRFRAGQGRHRHAARGPHRPALVWRAPVLPGNRQHATGSWHAPDN
jgi:hypothetical protein